jgi:hypothetical protein
MYIGGLLVFGTAAGPVRLSSGAGLAVAEVRKQRAGDGYQTAFYELTERSQLAIARKSRARAVCNSATHFKPAASNSQVTQIGRQTQNNNSITSDQRHHEEMCLCNSPRRC